MHCLMSTVCDDLSLVFEQAWSGVMIFERRLSRVCGHIFVAFEDVVSKRFVLHRLFSTFFGDLLVVFVLAWSEIMAFERLLSRVCGDIIVVFEDVLPEMGAPVLGRVFDPWSVRI